MPFALETDYCAADFDAATCALRMMMTFLYELRVYRARPFIDKTTRPPVARLAHTHKKLPSMPHFSPAVFAPQTSAATQNE